MAKQSIKSTLREQSSVEEVQVLKVKAPDNLIGP